eukprot:3125780-Prymnesium_polylepis.1
MAAFRQCANATRLSGGWSVEYHIALDGGRSLSRHANFLSSLRVPVAPAGVRAILVTVLRDPLTWYESQWLNPSGTIFARLRDAVMRNKSNFNANSVSYTHLRAHETLMNL